MNVFLRKFLVSSLILLSFIAVDAANRTVSTLSNEDITLTESGEFHITSSTTPFLNSSINITHEDAWVFFDNIKPSKVIRDHISNIKINGAALINGSNARVAIYAHGTVVMAHGVDYKPLTVYTSEQLEGESMQLEIQTYHNDLKSFDKNIESFVLKRGYMATFASNRDGSGYSRVFIADETDLVFNTMPSILDNAVSFIRVFKHQWVSKKGKAGWDPNILDGTTYYDWNIDGNSSNDVEYAAIRQNGGWPSWDAINNKQDITHLLGFNEPDRPDQSDMTMATMIAQWPAFMKSGLRVGSPAWSSEYNSVRDGGNLFDFIDQCDDLNYRVDFVALHCYWVKSPQQWYNDLKYVHDRTGRPLWITEWNNGANWTTENWPAGNRAYNDANALKQLNDIKGILEVLDTASFIERYFIFDWVEDCRAMELNGGLTKAGEYYAANKSDIAYNSRNEVIPSWKFKEINLEYTYSYVNNSITLSWEDSNGGLSKAYVIEQKIGDGEFEELATLDLSSRGFSKYMLTPSTSIAGQVQYRVKAQLENGSFKETNTVSFYLTSKENFMEVASLNYSDDNYNVCLFSGEFESSPVAIMGATSNNNSSVNGVPRIYPLLPYYFEFSVQSFDYVNDNNFLKEEEIGLIALPEGVYSDGAMEFQAKKIRGVKNYWVDVIFEEPFSSVPVVMATQYSKKNANSVSIAIRNVSTTGFQMKLKAEVGGSVSSSENVSYFAATQGTGMIDNKRVKVGKIPAAVGGIARYDETYTKPIIFAGLQTSNDELASVVRVSAKPDRAYYLLYKKEATAGSTTIAEDELGYMIFDIASGQTAAELVRKAQFEFFPNPAKNHLNFNFEENTKVEIVSMTGQKLLVGEVKNEFDISELSAGNYLVKVAGKGVRKLVVMP